MLRRILGESQRRTIFTSRLEKILHPLNRLILKIPWFKETEISMPFGESRFFFRPFVFSDLIMLFTDWEPYIMRVFQPNKGETVIDVGAHIGLYTLSAAKKVGLHGTVISFEPDPRNFSLLKKNIKTNRFKGITIFNAALDKQDSSKILYLSADPLFTSMTPSAHAKERIEVQTLTLDHVAEKLNLTHVDWIKIDVEGNEMNVLEGGKRTFDNLVEHVIIETTNPEVIHFLSERGFSIHKLCGINYLASKSKNSSQAKTND
jgi:FkbM family methyltransferase